MQAECRATFFAQNSLPASSGCADRAALAEVHPTSAQTFGKRPPLVPNGACPAENSLKFTLGFPLTTGSGVTVQTPAFAGLCQKVRTDQLSCGAVGLVISCTSNRCRSLIWLPRCYYTTVSRGKLPQDAEGSFPPRW